MVKHNSQRSHHKWEECMAKLTNEEEQARREDNLLSAMVDMDGWKQVFHPYLMDKLNQSFPDPSKFTKEEEFLYAAKVTSVFKKVIAELLQFVDQKVEEGKFLEDKKKSKKKDEWEIGA
jgi:hypothetical protein